VYGPWVEDVKHSVLENGPAGQREQQWRQRRRCSRFARGRAAPRRGQVDAVAGVLDPVVGPVGVRTAQRGPVPDAHQSRAVPGTVQARAGRRPGGVVQAHQAAAADGTVVAVL